MTDKDDALAKQVGLALAGLRRTRGMTQDALADAARVERETISRIERGVMVPSLQRLGVFANVLGVSLAELLGSHSLRPRDQAEHVLDLLDMLDEPDRDFVMRWFTDICVRLAR